MKTPQRAVIALLIANQMLWIPGAYAAPPAGSAYHTDHEREVTYVHDATSEGIGELNSILCFVKAMGAGELVNEGNYAALIDENLCDDSARSDAGKSSSSNDGDSAPDYNRALVNSSRESNSAPMVVKAWVPVSGGNGNKATVYARATASEPPSTSNPYGVFRMDYCGKVAGEAGCIFNGFINATAAGIQYFERQVDEPGQTEDWALSLTRNSTTGQGALKRARTGRADKTFTFAYDDAYFRRAEETNDECFARDPNDAGVRESVWRYGLYSGTTGDRIDRNGGFPVKYTAGGETYQGYVGYYGMNFRGDVIVPNGASVTKQSFSANDAGQSYTLVKNAGKLMKFTKNETTLNGIKNVRFNFGAFNGAVPGLAGTQGKQLEAYWNGTNLVITGEFFCDGSGCKTKDDGYPRNASTTGWATDYPGGVFGYSQSLGGEVFINLSGTNPSSGTQVNYRTQSLVYPDEMAAIGTLHCLRDCPDADSLAAYDPNEPSSSPYISGTANSFAPSANTVSYTPNASSGTLDRSGSAVVFDGETGGRFRNGIRTGKLVPAAALPDVLCGPGSPDSYCEHRTNRLDTFYIWEVGPNPWNQFTALKDGSGAYLKFDAPLQVNFSVPDDSAKYGENAGSQIVLQYNGFGNLFGIPGRCVSPTNNQQVSCNSEKARYVAAFSIPFDDAAGRVTSANGTPYLVGSLEREIRLARKPLTTCTARPALTTLPSAAGLPTSADLKDPANASDASYIGEPPTVTATPRVVQGVKKY